MKYLISIIVPVYNSQSTIRNTINSVFKQTIGFENIELILVDDNSSDNSRSIIANFMKKYKNIKGIFFEKNSGGASLPRNIGISKSTADYMIFLDSDDELMEDYCEILYDKISKENVDIVHCNHCSKLNNKLYIPKDINEINHTGELCPESEKIFLSLTVWANIYKSSLIKNNNITFPNTLHEDGVFALNCLLKTKKPVLQINNYPGYIYSIENDNSLSHKTNPQILTKFLNGYSLCGDLLKEHDRKDELSDLFAILVNMSIFVLLKLNDIDEGIRLLYDFEKSQPFKITLNNVFFNFLNNKIINRKFLQSKILIKFISIFYNNRRIRDFVFIKFCNLKLFKK